MGGNSPADIDPRTLAKQDAAFLHGVGEGDVASTAQAEVIEARKMYGNDQSKYADFIREMQQQPGLSGYQLQQINFFDSRTYTGQQNVSDPKDLIPPENKDGSLGGKESVVSPKDNVTTYANGSSRGVHLGPDGQPDAINETDANGYSRRLRLIDGKWYSGATSEQGKAAEEPQIGPDGEPARGATEVKNLDVTKPVDKLQTDPNNPEDTSYQQGKNVEVNHGTVVTKNDKGDIVSYNANGFTLSKHDDGSWYVHEDNNPNAKFVKVSPDSIKIDPNTGAVRYLNNFGGTHTLGVDTPSLGGERD